MPFGPGQGWVGDPTLSGPESVFDFLLLRFGEPEGEDHADEGVNPRDDGPYLARAMTGCPAERVRVM